MRGQKNNVVHEPKKTSRRTARLHVASPWEFTVKLDALIDIGRYVDSEPAKSDRKNNTFLNWANFRWSTHWELGIEFGSRTGNEAWIKVIQVLFPIPLPISCQEQTTYVYVRDGNTSSSETSVSSSV
jgi:hypothetical protein